ncbi:putative Ig domain-containing protein [Bacillus ndiopicus]|uniref:putative Ig domain-containing protein n=1 Tax=Bacillus ndiopicus TaxID=1347368 RepID=UPI0005A9DE16|nr:putative Ig domain-containing protein [Bacillus ndiopicus]
MKKNRRRMNFTSYQQNLFSRYKIDEHYIQTNKQKRACLDLLEQVDKKQVVNEQKLIQKVVNAFRGSKIHRKVASCMTVVALMMMLQTTPIMVYAASSFTLAAQGPGSPKFIVLASDRALTADESINFTVNEVNSAPVLQEIGDQTVNEGGLLTFTALATDSDSAILTYSLVNEPAGASINATTGVFTWTPTEAQGPGSYTFTVQVSDGALVDQERITVTVNEVNSAPVLQVIGDQTVNEGDFLTFTVTATDTDLPANTLTYSLVGAPVGASINAKTGVFTWTPTEAQGPGSYTFTVRVSDGVLTDEESITITVNEVNNAPILQAIGNKIVNEGSELTFTAIAADIDLPANTLTYSLIGAPTGASINTMTGVFTWTPTEAQGPDSYTFTVQVSDGVLIDEESITVTVNEVNNAPELQAIGDKIVNEGSELTFTASATDSDSAILTYSLVNEPAGASINATTGVFTWTPTEAQGPGSYTFTVRVSDGALTDEESITVKVNEVNSAPVLQAIGNKTVNEKSELTFTVKATDEDIPVNTLTYSLVDAPVGAKINATTGVFTWTPAEAQGPGSYTFIVRVSDGALTDEESITVKVNEVNNAPVLQAIGNKTVDERSELTFTAIATDIDGDSLTYSLVDAPAGASVNATTGVFTWIPTEAQGPGTYSFKVVVSDGVLSAQENIAVTVNEVNSAPVLQAIGNKTVNEGSKLTFTVKATDTDIPANTLTYSMVGAPTGASINATTGVFTWTPTKAQGPGTYSFKVVVSDGMLSAEENITVTVNQINRPPISNDNDVTTTTPVSELETIKHKITFETNGGSAISIQNLEKNKNIIKPENPKREGYLFDGWYKDSEYKVKWDFDKDVITTSTTLYAKWIEISKEIDQSEEIEEKPTSQINFSDISTHWSNEMIEEIAALDIIKGYPDGTFRPNEPILRKHIATMITRALDLKPIRDITSFSDVLPTHPYYEEIQLLQQAGVVDGTNGQYKPNESLTRAQLAKIIVIAFDFELGEESNFGDLPKNHWSYRYVAALEKLGIVQGDNGKFNPQEPVTRAQFVAILYRALNLTK